MPVLDVINPKIKRGRIPSGSNLFPYYAGYSRSFVDRILGSVEIDRNGLVLDPWSGSGTTVVSASAYGFQTLGIDLNPVMVVVAKARMLSRNEYPSILPLAKSIVDWVKSNSSAVAIDSDDLLNCWFNSGSARILRVFELRINQLLVRAENYSSLKSTATVSEISSIAAFFYVILFRVVRKILSSFLTSNPTWIKLPASVLEKKELSPSEIFESFLSEAKVLMLCEGEGVHVGSMDQKVALRIGTAECLDLQSEIVDLVVTSPPYCTRIDYAVTTRVELAVLGFRAEEYDFLRRQLMGTSTVRKDMPSPDRSWGKTCNSFLEGMYSHSSIASKGYYYKNHLQYFSALSSSLSEVARVLKVGGKAVIVVQDSYYKDLHNDLPKVVEEMASFHGLSFIERTDFSSLNSMSKRNLNSRKYKKHSGAVESVIFFGK